MNPIELNQQPLVENNLGSGQVAIQPTSRAIRQEIELLNQKIADLQSVAAEVRKSELADVITEVRELLSAFEMTPDEFNTAFPVPADFVKAKRPVQTLAGYIGPNGERWSGGRGPKPRWVMDALSIGHRLEEFRAVSLPEMGPEDSNSGARPSLNRWRSMSIPQA